MNRGECLATAVTFRSGTLLCHPPTRSHRAGLFHRDHIFPSRVNPKYVTRSCLEDGVFFTWRKLHRARIDRCEGL